MSASGPVLAETRNVAIRLSSSNRASRPALADPAVHRRTPDTRDWIAAAATGFMTSFARSVTKDKVAIKADIALTWANGQTEKQNIRLKRIRW